MITGRRFRKKYCTVNSIKATAAALPAAINEGIEGDTAIPAATNTGSSINAFLFRYSAAKTAGTATQYSPDRDSAYLAAAKNSEKQTYSAIYLIFFLLIEKIIQPNRAAKKAKKKGAGRNLSAAKTTAFRRTKFTLFFAYYII